MTSRTLAITWAVSLLIGAAAAAALIIATRPTPPPAQPTSTTIAAAAEIDHTLPPRSARSREIARTTVVAKPEQPQVTATTSPAPRGIPRDRAQTPATASWKQTTTTASTPVAIRRDSDDRWARLRQCESHGDYTANTGNGYYGAYQFSAKTWHSLGLGGLPHEAAPADQDAAARRLLARSGWRQWPNCGKVLR